MVPACRTTGEALAPPPCALEDRDVDGVLHELPGFHATFRHGFTRREPREHCFRSRVGPLSPVARKSIEPMALEVEGGHVRGLQRFIGDDIWDEPEMSRTYQQLVSEEMGAPDGVVSVDESRFVKKEKDSVGVARQDGGTLGKVETCQVGVLAA